jgi:hypothetical protein
LNAAVPLFPSDRLILLMETDGCGGAEDPPPLLQEVTMNITRAIVINFIPGSYNKN